MDNTNNSSNNNTSQTNNQTSNTSLSTSQNKCIKKDSNQSTKNKDCKSSCNSNSNNITTSANNKLNLELYKFSYADFVLLSSTLAYAIGEDLNDPDLDILIAFFGMITADLAILRTRRGIINGLAKAADNNNTAETDIIGATEATQAAESLSSVLGRNTKKKARVKKIKRKKVRKKKNKF